MGVRVAKGSPGGSREYSHRLIPGLPRRAPGAVHDGSKFSTRRKAAGDTPRTRGIPPKWLQDEPASAGQPRGLHPPPPPPRGGNLKAQNQATVSWGRGGRASRRGDPARTAGAEARRGQSRVPGGARGPAQALAAHPLPRRHGCPGPGRGAPARGATHCLAALTHAPHGGTPARAGPAEAARAPRLRPGGALPPASRAPPPRPGPASRGSETLHSPEFLHVCGRGLRETKREGQQAGGVRSAAAPGGAGHRGHGRARRRGASRGSVGGKPGPRAPSPCPHPPAAVPETQGVRRAAAE